MADYCCNGTVPGDCGGDSKLTVSLKFLRSQLLYDIRNYAFIEGDVMGDDKQHAQHVLIDIGEDGNVDRVSRILAVVHSAVIELLYPWTKSEPVEEEIDNILSAPDEYVVELHVPEGVSRTTMQLLSRLIHEYMVYSVLADWLSITNPDAAANWAAKAEAVAAEITRAKSCHKGVFTRNTHPW